MAYTPRFGFSYFGGSVDGALFDDADKYTSRDRLMLDRILAAFENHRHGGGDALEDPEGEPTLTLIPGSGELPAGTVLYYRVAYVDQYGLETAAGDEAAVVTPSAVQAPDAPLVEAEPGGTLPVGIHWYGLTGHVGSQETPLSDPQVANISDWNQVRIEAPNGLPAGIDSVSIWRQGPTDPGFTRLATVAVPDPENPPTPLFTDDGSIASDPCACDPENLPPNFSTAGAASSVEITVPSTDVEAGSGVLRWRIYRSEQSGNYPAASLVADVSETVDEFGSDLVNSFVDDGENLFPGRPLPTSQTLQPAQSLDAAAVVPVPPNVQTESYTLVASDVGKAVEMDLAGANTVTVPTNASVAVPIGAIVEVCQVGAGQTTLVADGGVTLRTPGGLTLVLRGQWSTVSLRKRDTDEWVVAGDLQVQP